MASTPIHPMHCTCIHCAPIAEPHERWDWMLAGFATGGVMIAVIEGVRYVLELVR